MLKDLRQCNYDGCSSAAHTQGLCVKHYRVIAGRKASGGIGRRLPGAELSEEMRADIVRRMRRFESPSSIAKDLGVNVTTVRLAMKGKP